MAFDANLGSLLYTGYASTWYPIVPWVGTHILHMKMAIDVGALVTDGVGDTAFEYVEIFIFLVRALITTLAWSLLDIKENTIAIWTTCSGFTFATQLPVFC